VGCCRGWAMVLLMILRLHVIKTVDFEPRVTKREEVARHQANSYAGGSNINKL
jgi:hypothetical protein